MTRRGPERTTRTAGPGQGYEGMNAECPPAEEVTTLNRASSEDARLPPGVREVEHTADLGIEVEADSLEALFGRAAAGMMALVRDEGPGTAGAPAADADAIDSGGRAIELEVAGEDVSGLLVRWLRELLYLQEVDGFVYGGADFEQLDASSLRAWVRPQPAPAPQIRELKGVTYHGLEVERTRDVEGTARGWRARVIFDI